MAKRRTPHDTTLAVADETESATLSSRPAPPQFSKANSHFPWDEFDPSWYFDLNYKNLRDDDQQIVEIVRDFFSALDLPRKSRQGIDVGAGVNLYPALTMLPFCDEITLREYAAPNVAWLEREILCYSPSWDPSWNLLIKDPLYKSVDSPREALAAAVRIQRGSIFDLPESQWDIGTMFFVAESISSVPAEFHSALDSFVKSLRPGAPFAAAFMENSLGYDVGAHHFPAVAITQDDVEEFLEDKTEDFRIHRLGKTKKPLRDGYDGMILAVGKV
ncbi:MAG: SCO2525 family SAM-dependent methyltransferase [Pseudonocardiales bacterium]